MSTLTKFAGLVSEDELAANLQEIIGEYENYKQKIRRSESREAISIPVEATLLDDSYHPIAESFHVVTRDISSRGVGVFHDRVVTGKYIYLKFHSPVSFQDFGVIASVEHCTPCGKYFIIGCRFLTEQFTTDDE